MPKMIHCSICKAEVANMSLALEKRFDKLREHRKEKHPKAHKQSMKKALQTRKKKAKR